VQTQLHFICLTGNFRKGVVRLNWVAKWVAAWKRLKITGLEVLRIFTRKMLVSQLNIRGVCRCHQWRTQKILMGGIGSGSYGGYLHLMCAVCDVTIWCHVHVFKPTFWRSLLTWYAYFSTSILLILCVVALNINYQRSKLGYQRKTNSTLRHNSS